MVGLRSIYGNCSLHLKSYIFVRSIILDFEKLAGYVPKKAKSVIDIGCGYGLLSFALASKNPGMNVKGYDFNEKRIKKLNEISPFKNASFYAEDAADSPTKADAIFIVDLLHHIPYDKQEKLIKNVAGNVSKKGRIIVKEMNGNFFLPQYWVNFFIDVLSAKQYPLFYRKIHDFKKLFKLNGLEVEIVSRINKWWIPLDHVVFVLRKK